jgi:hypothetical protein
MSCVPVRGQRKGTGYHCLWRVPAIAKQVPPPEGTMMCSESSLGPLSRGTVSIFCGWCYIHWSSISLMFNNMSPVYFWFCSYLHCFVFEY